MAALDGQSAARGEGTTGADLSNRRDNATNRLELPIAIDARHRCKQRFGIRVFRGSKKFVDRRGFDDFSGIHHRDTVSDQGHHTEVMGDEHDGQSVLALQVLDQRQDLGLDGDVERCGGLVGQQQPGLAGQGDRDHHPLPHPA